MWQWSISEGPLFSPCFDLYKKLLLSAFNEIEIKPKKPLEEIPPSSLFIHFVSPLLYRKSTNNNVVASRDDILYFVCKQMISSPIHSSLFPLQLLDLNSAIAETGDLLKLQ